MDDERLPKWLFYGDAATGSRRQWSQIRCFKAILKASLERLQINPVNWEDTAPDLPAWRKPGKTGATINEANRITATKAKREAGKSQLTPHRNVTIQPPPARPRCQRTFRTPIGPTGHLRTNCSSRKTPPNIPRSTSGTPPPPNADNQH
ncbi:hypothetical protein SprV_0200932200 [Sparganum proliferum]